MRKEKTRKSLELSSLKTLETRKHFQPQLMRGFRSKAGRRCRSRGAQAVAGAGDAGHLDITSYHQVQEMEETFVEFLKLNESKNIMAFAGTPLTLAGL